MTKPYGEYMTWKTAKYDMDGEPVDVLLITGAVLKRKKKRKKAEDQRVYKIIALPLDETYEPWTQDLLAWAEKRGNLNFRLSRQTIWRIVRRHLSGLYDGMTHTLRHFRVTYLITEYNFDPFDLCAYAGWTMKTGMGAAGMGAASGQLDVYAHLAWKRYFPKLLKPIDKLT